jgi:hypothetical protein
LVNNKTKLQINNFKFSVFNSNKIIWLYLYNNNYSIFLKLNSDNRVKIISSITILLEKYSYSNYINIFLQKYTKQFYFYEYVKIKFSGKGYKIKKNGGKSMLLLFNRAHITQTW